MIIMRSADAATLWRVLIIIFVAYLILVKFNPLFIIFLIAVAMFMDAVDGYLALNEVSGGKVSFKTYFGALSGNEDARKIVKGYKEKLSKTSKFGPRIDVAGDRAVEYILWIVYTYVNVVPFFVIILIVLRHSFVDAVMASKGTSSKMKTRLAKVLYSSNIARGGINVMKFITFSYLALACIWGYPLYIGYILTAILVVYILLRGVAEIYEAYAE